MVFSPPKNVVVLYIAALAVLLFIIAFVHQQTEQNEELKSVIAGATNKIWPFKSPSSSEEPLPSFFEIAKAQGTDKVGPHHYEDMYEVYFPSIRHKKLKMLEIGLGCDMSYGPGASYYTWLEYFPNVELYFMEYDADLLENFMKEHGKDFDIIIDDGGHTMVQQMTSLQYLWKAVKPGGLYFIEDLETSFLSPWGGGDAATSAGQDTTISYIQKLIAGLTNADARHVNSIDFQEVEKIVHVDCSQEVCALVKRA
ncbi:hard-surface induced protein 5 [Diaporthe helianthi]|uniref:Hard-surface induced protein 5 n=1 Tax=Diaporthe helianthi TaxID=158607 RepID=A0A2P5HZG1_DIAHE|nr:hard-surface induced protein 5 [Diaporthe helianthi]